MRIVIRNSTQFTPLVVNIDHVRGMLYVVSCAHRNMFIAELYGDSIEEVRGYILDTCRLYKRHGGVDGRSDLVVALRWRRDAESNSRRKAIGGRISWLYPDSHSAYAGHSPEALELSMQRRERLAELRRVYRR